MARQRISAGAKAAETTVATARKIEIKIKAPNIREVRLRLDGSAPLMISKFSEKAKQAIKATHEEGTKEGKKKTKDKPPRDFDADCEAARHISTEGWDGVHAGAFRAAMISACRTVGFKMTLAKLAVMVLADGFDAGDGTPLIRIYGDHVVDIRHARNDNGGTDLRARPRYDSWHMFLTVSYDEDIFSANDIFNLMWRVGVQVGIGEGRPDSRNSPGIGFGTFSITSAPPDAVAAE